MADGRKSLLWALKVQLTSFSRMILRKALTLLLQNEKIQEYKKFASPYEAAKRGYVDDVIEPDSTRPRIIAALEMLASKRDSRPAKSMEIFLFNCERRF